MSALGDFYEQYIYLRDHARLGSGARQAYGFIAGSLRTTRSIGDSVHVVRARLITLGREANSRNRLVQNAALSQIAVLEHFLEQVSQARGL